MNTQNESNLSYRQARSRDNSMLDDQPKGGQSKSKGKKKADKAEAKQKKAWGERKIQYEPENKYISNSFMRYPLRGATHLQERPIYEKIEIGSRQNYAPTQHQMMDGGNVQNQNLDFKAPMSFRDAQFYEKPVRDQNNQRLGGMNTAGYSGRDMQDPGKLYQTNDRSGQRPGEMDRQGLDFSNLGGQYNTQANRRNDGQNDPTNFQGRDGRGRNGSA